MCSSGFARTDAPPSSRMDRHCRDRSRCCGLDECCCCSSHFVHGRNRSGIVRMDFGRCSRCQILVPWNTCWRLNIQGCRLFRERRMNAFSSKRFGRFATSVLDPQVQPAREALVLILRSLQGNDELDRSQTIEWSCA